MGNIKRAITKPEDQRETDFQDSEFERVLDEQTVSKDGNVDQEFESVFTTWMEENRVEDNVARVSLYKFDNFTSGNEKSFCSEWQNEIPSKHSIGLKFGSGRYLLLVSFAKTDKTPPIVKGKRFRLHPQYDELKRKEDEKNNVNGITSIVHTGNSLQDSVKVLAELINTIKPLMNSNANQPPPMVDMSPYLLQNYTMMQNVLKRSLMDQQKTIEDMRNYYENDIEESGDEMETATTGNSLIDTLLPLAEKYLPTILGNSPQAKLLVNVLKNLPQFKAIVDDKKELGEWVDAMDAEVGKNKTDKFLKRIGISRPTLEQ